jgi:hypothetical protein
MALVVYPQVAPSQSPNLKTFERGQQNFVLSNIGVVQTFSGTALPAGSIALAVPACRADETGIENFTIQIDSGGGTPAAVIHLLGSLDGTTWYDLLGGTALQAAGTYGLFYTSKLWAVGVKTRYISAYASAYAGSGGTTDSISVSLYA